MFPCAHLHWGMYRLPCIGVCTGCCRGVVHFDYVSGQGVSKNAPVLDDSDLNALLWKKCNLSVQGEREQSLSPEKQVMRLRMLAPLLAVNSTQVSMHSVADVTLTVEVFFWLDACADLPADLELCSTHLHVWLLA